MVVYSVQKFVQCPLRCPTLAAQAVVCLPIVDRCCSLLLASSATGSARKRPLREPSVVGSVRPTRPKRKTSDARMGIRGFLARCTEKDINKTLQIYCVNFCFAYNSCSIRVSAKFPVVNILHGNFGEQHREPSPVFSVF